MILGLANEVLQRALYELAMEADWETAVRAVLKNEGLDSEELVQSVLAVLDTETYEFDVSIYTYKKDQWEDDGDAMVAAFRD